MVLSATHATDFFRWSTEEERGESLVMGWSLPVPVGKLLTRIKSREERLNLVNLRRGLRWLR
jgi:hypothetical protein